MMTVKDAEEASFAAGMAKANAPPEGSDLTAALDSLAAEEEAAFKEVQNKIDQINA